MPISLKHGLKISVFFWLCKRNITFLAATRSREPKTHLNTESGLPKFNISWIYRLIVYLMWSLGIDQEEVGYREWRVCNVEGASTPHWVLLLSEAALLSWMVSFPHYLKTLNKSFNRPIRGIHLARRSQFLFCPTFTTVCLQSFDLSDPNMLWESISKQICEMKKFPQKW